MSTARTDSSNPGVLGLVAWYLALTAVVVLIRGAASLVGGPAWLINSMPWSEVFYGPAIAVACMFGAPAVAARIEARLKDRRA
jgi:hypothetical protein